MGTSRIPLHIVIKGTRKLGTMKVILLPIVVLAAVALAQDTHHCPDGWDLYDRHGQLRCYLLSNNYVAKQTADTICGQYGGWVAEVTHPSIDYFLKDLLFQQDPNPGQGHQFWLGAFDRAHDHDIHQVGDWFWPHYNMTADWFDWADGQPNNIGHSQNCLTFLEYNRLDIYRDFFWNDEGCDEIARPICEKPADDFNKTVSRHFFYRH